MSRAHPLPALVAALACAAACRGASERVDIPLDTFAPIVARPASWQVLQVDTHAQPVMVTGPATLSFAPGGTLEVAFRVPDHGEVRFRPSLSGQLRFRQVVGGASVELTPVEGSAETRVYLAGRPGEPARLHVENAGPSPVVVREAHICGTRAPVAPPLPAAVRPKTTPLNVVVYLVDAMRASHLSLYGYGRETTPRLAARAGRGATIFDAAYAAGPSTSNSIPSLFTSRYPSEVGYEPKRAPRTLAEAFAGAGYRTAAFTANPLMRAELGYDRGFQRYERIPRPSTPAHFWPLGETVQDAALAWIAEARERPFFLYVHVLDVHSPYQPPAPFAGRFAGDGKRMTGATPPRPRGGQVEWVAPFAALGHPAFDPDRYDEAIAYVDDLIDRFVGRLEALGVRDRTAILVLADHGEALGAEDDGTFMHGQSLFEELVRVPLVLFLPGAQRESRVGEIVSLVDVAPTLADLAGIPAHESWLGRSLFSPVSAATEPLAVFELLGGPGGGPPERDRVFSARAAGVRADRWKLIVGPDRTRLFDLPADPKETKDVSAREPAVVDYLSAQIARFSPVGHREAKMRAPLAPEHPEVIKALKALGYVQ